MSIRQLDSSIYNKIAAGEVVERPRSVVKELVENAIDAGANRISVAIVDGGKTSIEISDNGCGISTSDIKTAFLPHATSKIENIDDLFTISTLGFRGEALASIASISQVAVQSQCRGSAEGVQLTIEGGVFGEVLPWSGADGTSFIVKNIFYNTPAREKFLKSIRGEESEISTLVQEFIISNPNVSISYRADGKLIYSSQGNGLMDSLYTVYDKAVTESLLYVNYTKGAISVQGYISKPNFTKSTRSYQTTIINGRVVTNSNVSAAVNQGYAQTLMKRAFPVYVLDITMPFDQVDVNVTPNKSDVRFSDNRLIFSAIYNAVKETLDKYATASVISLVEKAETVQAISSNISQDIEILPNEQKNYSYNTNTSILSSKIEHCVNDVNNNKAVLDEKDNTNQNELLSKLKNIQAKESNSKTFGNLVAENSSPIFNNYNHSISSFTNKKPIVTIENAAQDSLATFISNQLTNANDVVASSNTQEKIADLENRQVATFDCNNNEVRIIGQVFNAYLIISKGEKMYILDQHACHERLIYDDLCKALNENELAVQPLLIPQVYSLSPIDFDTIMSLKADLKKIGIDIEEFGTYTVKVNEIPVIIQNFNLKSFIDEILTSSKFNKVKLADILKDRLAITACKASIRAGEKLNEYEIESLISMMKDNLPLQCPHGRPAVLTFDRKDIDKMFKRIL